MNKESFFRACLDTISPGVFNLEKWSKYSDAAFKVLVDGGAGAEFEQGMSSPTIDPINLTDYTCLSREPTSHWQCQHKSIYTAILLIISAAHILGMSETSAKHKNAKWNNNEVFWMMEFLVQHASTAGDGGNFPASKYNEAASHLAQYWDSGSNIKTGDQVKII